MVRMEDRISTSTTDRFPEQWAAQSEDAESARGILLENARALLETPAGEPLARPGMAPTPSSVSDTLAPESMRAGMLTRGRRRDLEAGFTVADTLKIVYWGPGRSGKTTNVKWIHSRLRPELRGQLVDIDTPGERTLYFDCLPLDLTPSGQAPLALRLFTVPGQPRFRLTRTLVLDGVDGIVFVWDARSRRLNANLASLIEMRETLAELGISWSQIPRVVQYNKLDLPDQIPPEELDHVLDRMGERVPRFRAVATQGTGVLETLGSITGSVLRRQLARERAERLAAAGL
jgi:mutual gliding-motility protein MglA